MDNMDNIDNNTDNMDNDLIEDLDTSWINEFEKEDDEYKNYYSEDISFIKIHFIYTNKNDEIEKIKEEKILLNTLGVLHKEELLRIIKNNSFLTPNSNYLVSFILKINIVLEPENLKTFLNNKSPQNIGSSFLQPITTLDSIYFKKTIAMFHDINNILIIFTPSTSTNANTNKHKYTKKALIHFNKKTKKRI